MNWVLIITDNYGKTENKPNHITLIFRSFQNNHKITKILIQTFIKVLIKMVGQVQIFSNNPQKNPENPKILKIPIQTFSNNPKILKILIQTFPNTPQKNPVNPKITKIQVQTFSNNPQIKKTQVQTFPNTPQKNPVNLKIPKILIQTVSELVVIIFISDAALYPTRRCWCLTNDTLL